MYSLANLRDVGLLLVGALIAVGLLTLPNRASSDYRAGETIEGAIQFAPDRSPIWESQPDNTEGWGGITREHRYLRPATVTSQIYPNSPDCGAIKLDVWYSPGRLTYSLFSGFEQDRPLAQSTDVPGRSDLLIGAKACRVRIVIERDPTP